MKTQMTNKHNLNQVGMVSIMVTLIMMMVITLIVTGFTEVSRRNQREALDRQLSAQAFYAAETGVNDVIHLVGTSAGKYNPTADLKNYNSCRAGDTINNFMEHFPAVKAESTLDASTNTAYTCLLVTPKVKTIVETVSLSDSVAVPIRPDGATDLQFTWQSSDGSSSDAGTCPTNTIANNFKPNDTDSADWQSNCNFGILRLDLFDVNANGGSTDPDTMASHTAAVYVVPTNAGSAASSLNYNAANIVTAHCTAGNCKATIRASAFSGSPMNLYARLSGIYESLGSVTIASTAGGVSFPDAQLLVDATGKAQDELKRIQVRVPLNGQIQSLPSNALQSTNAICKRFKTLGSGYLAVQSTPGGSDGDTSNITAELCASGD